MAIRFERPQVLPAALEHVYAETEGRERLLDLVLPMEKAFGLCACLARRGRGGWRVRVAFFQTMKAMVVKSSPSAGEQRAVDVEGAIRQRVSKALIGRRRHRRVSRPRPEEARRQHLVRGVSRRESATCRRRNLAVELLKKLLGDDLKARARATSSSRRPSRRSWRRPSPATGNRAIETVQVIGGAARAREGIHCRQAARSRPEAHRGRTCLL